MASTKNGKKTANKNTKSKKDTQKDKVSRQPVEKNEHSRRWIGALVCLGAFLISALSCLGVKSIFTNAWELVMKGLFGAAGFYILPFSLFVIAVILMLHRGRPVKARVICAMLMVVCIGALAHLMSDSGISWTKQLVKELWHSGVTGEAGGLLCGFIAMALEACLSKIGAAIILAGALIVCILYALNMTIPSIVKAIQNRPRLEPEEEPPEQDRAAAIVNHVAQRRIDRIQQKRAREKNIQDYDLPVDEPPGPGQSEPVLPEQGSKPISPDQLIEQRRAEAKKKEKREPEFRQPEPVAAPAPQEKEAPEPSAATQAMVQEFVQNMPKKVDSAEAKASAVEIAQEIIGKKEDVPAPAYIFPTLDLLTPPETSRQDGTQEMRENARRLDETLKSFNIDAHIVNVTRGPSITRYELELDRGVKLSKITGLADDIALSLGASGVRISAIPDKISVVGIEVPNRLVSKVYAREVIGSDAFYRAKSPLSFAVGKDIGGMSIVGDIAKLPHMLIAGTTGAGKSVCMNSLIISLLYKASPEQVKLIMIDPKMVELGGYNGIPHLLIPVVTDPKKAAGALQWAVTEMMRRYRMMADAGVRSLAEYNKLAAVSDEYEATAQLVVVIDELADLMLVAAKDVEEAICRVAQMGRAAGIHLIVATQRPSADVITGLMKANIPSRIAFAVASAMESRIILDTAGAEKLVGKGDMLYSPLGEGKPKRVQGCLITDEEVQRIVKFIKDQQLDTGETEQKKILDQIESKSQGKEAESAEGAPLDSEGDELLPAAVEVCLELGMASVSMLQRRLKLGYARAARIVDEMEDRGIVGPFEGSKPRTLLINREQWQAMQNGEQLTMDEPVPEEIP